MAAVWRTMVGVLAALSVWAPSALADVVISEVLADPPMEATGDVNHDGSRSAIEDEFVEVSNTGTQATDLSNWSLSDATKVRHSFPAGTTLAPGQSMVIFGGGKPQGFKAATPASTGGLSLNNNGDVLTLRDAAMEVMDSLSYGSAGEKEQSLVRNRDGELVLHTSIEGADGALFSPGTILQQ